MALIAIYSVLTLPFTTLVLTPYFRGLPDEVDEAARVEGASSWRIEATNYDVFRRRVRLSSLEKSWILVQALVSRSA